MPTYEYSCPGCGPFDELRTIAERDAPAPCPACRALAPRVLFTAPLLSSLSQEKRQAHAINERSAHSPRCGCAVHAKKSNGRPRAFPDKRPWMISH